MLGLIKSVENNYCETPYNPDRHKYPEYWHTKIKICQDMWIKRDTLLEQLPHAVFTEIDEKHNALVVELNSCSPHDEFSVKEAYIRLNVFHTNINKQMLLVQLIH